MRLYKIVCQTKVLVGLFVWLECSVFVTPVWIKFSYKSQLSCRITKQFSNRNLYLIQVSYKTADKDLFSNCNCWHHALPTPYFSSCLVLEEGGGVPSLLLIEFFLLQVVNMSASEIHASFAGNGTYKSVNPILSKVGDFTPFYIAIAICSVILGAIIILNVVCCCSRYSDYWLDRHTGGFTLSSYWNLIIYLFHSSYLITSTDTSIYCYFDQCM